MNALNQPDWWLPGDRAAPSRTSHAAPPRIAPDLVPRNDLGVMLEAVLSVTGWPGGPEHLADALPHVGGPPDVTALRATLANLGYRSAFAACPPAVLQPADLPAILLPARRPAVLLFIDEAGTTRRLVAGAAESEPATSLAAGVPLLRVMPPGQARPAAARDGWVATVLRRFAPALPTLLLCSLMLALLALAAPLFTMAVFDMLIGGRTAAPLPMLLAGLAAAIAFEGLFRAVRVRLLARLGGRIDSLIAASAFDRLLGLPLAMTERVNVSAQVARVRDFATLREFFSGSLALAALDAPFALLLLGVLAIIGGPVALAPVLAVLAFGLLFLAVRQPMRRAVAALAVSAQERDQIAAECLGAMRLLRATACTGIWQARHAGTAAEAAIAGARMAMLAGTVAALGQAITSLAALSAIGLGVHAVLAGTITGGALIASMMVIWRVLGPLQLVFTILSRLEQLRTSVRQTDQLMAIAPEREPGQAVRPTGTLRGDVVLNRVSLRYLPQAEPALLGVSFEVRAGQVVAVTGASGAGKTTLLQAIMGLHRATSGTVRIDGFDIRRFDPVELRRAIAYVPAVPQVLYGTIAQNLLLANPAASRAEMLEAARLTGLDRLVGRQPEGFETRVTDSGAARLPGSLLARLSLTRALLREARIVLLDEPANGLDEDGTEAVRRVVDSLRGRSTVFLVTHRPSHVALADRVFRMQEGQMEEVRRPAAALPLAVPLRPTAPAVGPAQGTAR